MDRFGPLGLIAIPSCEGKCNGLEVGIWVVFAPRFLSRSQWALVRAAQCRATGVMPSNQDGPRKQSSVFSQWGKVERSSWFTSEPDPMPRVISKLSYTEQKCF